MPISYFSNLAFIGNKLIDLLNEYKYNIKFIQTTIDGLEFKHNKNRSFPNSFKITISNIDKMLKLGLPVIVRTNVGENNVDDIPQIADFYEQKGWFNYPQFKGYLTHTYDRHHEFTQKFTLDENIAYSKYLDFRDRFPLVRKLQGIKFAPSLRNIIDAFNQFRTGQMDLPTFIMTILTNMANAYTTIFMTIVTAVGNFARSLIQKGINAAMNFVNGIINRIKQLPGKVYSALISVVSRIVSAGAQWVSNAKQKALDVVNGAYNTLSGLPGKVASALGGVVDAIVKPFRDAYDQAKGWWDKITSLDLSFGGEAAYGGETAMSSGGQAFNINTGEYVVSESGPLVIEDNVNISLDLQNVPATINTDQLISALSDRSVLSAIAGNRDFQTLDANVKKRISLRNARRG